MWKDNINRQFKRNNRGVTLLEILFAVTIFALALIPIVGVISRQGRISSEQNEGRLIALNHARETVEQFKNMEYTDIIVPDTATDAVQISDTPGTRTYLVNGLNWDDDPNTYEAKEITVEVAWKERQRLQYQKLVTIVTDEHVGIVWE